MRLAAVDLLVGAAKRAEALEGFHQPERDARLLPPRALADDTVRAALGQRPGSVSDDCAAHDCLRFGQLGRVFLDPADGLGDLLHLLPLRQGCGFREVPARDRVVHNWTLTSLADQSIKLIAVILAAKPDQSNGIWLRDPKPS